MMNCLGCRYLGATLSLVCPPKASKNTEVDSCDRREDDLQMKGAAHWYRMVNPCRGHRENRSKHLLHFHVQPVEKPAVAHSPFSALLAVSESLASLIRGSGSPCPQQSLNSVMRQKLTLLNPCVPPQCSPGLETILHTETLAPMALPCQLPLQS